GWAGDRCYGDLADTRADWPRSDQTVPLDHNEALGPTKPANLVVIADHFTEWAGGRPHTDVRLANSFDPRLVKPRLTGAVGRDVENPVTDLGSDPTPVLHACSRSRFCMSFQIVYDSGADIVRRAHFPHRSQPWPATAFLIRQS